MSGGKWTDNAFHANIEAEARRLVEESPGINLTELNRAMPYKRVGSNMIRRALAGPEDGQSKVEQYIVGRNRCYYPKGYDPDWMRLASCIKRVKHCEPVLRCLQKRQPMTRMELQDELGLKKTATHTLMWRLVGHGILDLDTLAKSPLDGDQTYIYTIRPRIQELLGQSDFQAAWLPRWWRNQ